MSTDPQLRATALASIREALATDREATDRARLHAFLVAIFDELPDTFVLASPPATVARHISKAYDFVVHTVPPPFQVYRGAPGLHVQARNPGDEDVTVVETHTAHVPFIFESLKNYFQRQGLRVLLAIHPLFSVQRRWERVIRIADGTEDGAHELYCQFRIERVESRDRLRRIEHQVHAVLKSVFLAVEDFPAMLGAIQGLAQRLRGVPRMIDGARAFLSWLADDNFVVLGVLRYQRAAHGALEPNWSAPLGVFRDRALLPVVFPGLMDRFAAYPAPASGDERIVEIEYSPNASAIHHLEPLDVLAVRDWGADGRVESATLLVGRLAKSAFSVRPQEMPLLRDKLQWLLDNCGTAAGSHLHRATRAVFNQFPKRELLYAKAGALKPIIDAIVRLTGDVEVAVSTRHGAGYQALYVAFSKIRYSHRVEEELTSALTAEIGPVSFHTWADCGDAALLVFYFPESSQQDDIDLETVRTMVGTIITTWEDRTAMALDRTFGPTDGRRLLRRYVRAEERSGLYREITPPDEVPEDVRRFEQLQDRLEIRIVTSSSGSATLKLFSPAPLELVDTLRTLEHLGLVVREEVSIALLLPEGRRAFLQRLRVEASSGGIDRLSQLEPQLLDALRALHEERAANDPLNGLLLAAGLQWREIALLRTLRNYMLQIRPQYTVDTLTTVLLSNRRVAAALFRLFAARFDPGIERRQEALDACENELELASTEVASLLHDEILQGIEDVIRSLVRTNFYQQPERPVIAVKIDSRQVRGLPAPRPLVEIYVHSPMLEGVHLRGGRVARGGIRWSDRPDDFRAEVLGLMQTQMLKNSIIVPVGAKGGFVLKSGQGRRAGGAAMLVDRYREFVSGLLDVTDNRVGGAIEHPPQVVRYDDDDPYLVVAADKGTSHLSDTANQVSAQYGFWLGDAFASGGSNGYDHKKEAITARGAWASVEHHFRRLGIDPARQPFTVVGLGDMSGDVFGNGLLRSQMTKLVGAFNHQHIFLDPDPDPAASFAERERLFHLPRSTWRDYDPSRISRGGGVFERGAKAIPLSAEAKALLDTDADTASGEEVVRRLLCARVDLLYNGGIGTYVKASDEDTAAIADRANDRVRVDANQLKARAVAEGGNLGLTQKARIEYWSHGGLINTDAVDNSGGVSMSDHEVNIKILLDLLLREGRIASQAGRSDLLSRMTSEVAQLVLVDNVLQARALTLDGLRSASRYDDFQLVIDHLLVSGAADRGSGLPGREELAAYAQRHHEFPRPVLAVAMALVKNWASVELLKTAVVDGPLADPFLHAYFPQAIRSQFADRLATHPLRREIVATAMINHVVNHAGISLIPRLMIASAVDPGAIVAAYLAAEQASNAVARRREALDAGLEVNVEHERLLQIEDEVEQSARTLLGAAAGPDADEGLQAPAEKTRSVRL